MTNNDMAKLCEIAVIYGQLLEQGKVKHFDDLLEAFEAFSQLYDEWLAKSLANELDDEESAYVTAYMNRVIPIKFGLSKEE